MIRNWSVTKEEVIEILEKIRKYDFDTIEVDAICDSINDSFDSITFELWKNNHCVKNLFKLTRKER